MRRLLVVFVVVLVAAGVGWYVLQHVGQTVHHALTEVSKQGEKGALPRHQVAAKTTNLGTKPARKLTISNPFGSVEVVGGAAGISFESKTYLPGKTLEEARKLEVPIKVKTEITSEGEQKIEVVPIKDTPMLDVVVLDLKVKAPAGTPVSIEVTTGEGKVSGLTGGVAVHGQAGKVRVSECTGKVVASTTVGDLEVEDTTGQIEANTSSGALFADGVGGSVTARTMDGMANVKVTRGDEVTVSTMSGAIDVKVESPFSGQMEVRTMSGDIAVAIPSNSDCRVRTMTNTGAITCTLPLSKVERAGPNVSGQLGAGKGSVEVTNNSGAISVKPLE